MFDSKDGVKSVMEGNKLLLEGAKRVLRKI